MTVSKLHDLTVSTVIPVSDLQRSRRFYEQVLGLPAEEAPGGLVMHAGGGTRLYLMTGTDYAGAAKWPLASFVSDDLRATAAELANRGITLDREGTPFQTDERGVADAGPMLIAWFRDPDDQVLCVVQPT
jgi:catechol 2,3-dioxygenase-like lactoylglutathione lyase family enzyme